MLIRLIDIVDHSSKVYLIPLGDLHLGSPNIDTEKFDGYLDWIEKNKAYVFLMGDLFDVAVLNSPTEVWGQTMSLNAGIKLLYEKFMPIKNYIIGAISGNHEQRLIKYANFDPIQTLCDMLEISYCQFSAVLRFRIGNLSRLVPKKMISPRVEYIFFAHHTTGGGATLGGKLNRIAKLADIFEGADAYLGGHNHSKALGEDRIACLKKSGNGQAQIDYKKIMYIDTGSFLNYDGSYAEEKMLPPSHTGAVRIRMDGNKKDLHVSY